MTFYEKMTLKDMGLPLAYGVAPILESDPAGWEPPFLVYKGAGQESFGADDTDYYTRPAYELQYYFKTKDEDQERRIERILLDAGYRFDKSEDNYIQAGSMYVIYYEVR